MALCNWNKPMPQPIAARVGEDRKSGRRREAVKTERREVAQLLAQWLAFTGQGLPPSLDDVRRFLGPDGWSRRFLIAQDGDPHSSVLITCGESVAEIFGPDVKGRTLRDIAWDGCRPLLDGCIEAAMTRQPTTVEGTLRSPTAIMKPFRGIILPFGNKRDCIPYLLGAVGWVGEQPALLREGH